MNLFFAILVLGVSHSGHTVESGSLALCSYLRFFAQKIEHPNICCKFVEMLIQGRCIEINRPISALVPNLKLSL